MTHAPFFTCRLADESELKDAVFFHKDSPAGQLEKKLSGKRQGWVFKDPHSGGGGFGGSTAEFISVYKILKADGSLQDIRSEYFKLFEGLPSPPSGADLVTQYSEKPGLFIYSKDPFNLECVSWPFEDMSVLILKTGFKLKTHSHLKHLKESDFSALTKFSKQVISSLKLKKEKELLTRVKEFSAAQETLGLLHNESAGLVKMIDQIEGVQAARGCGAMGADVLAVFVKKESLDYVWGQIENLGRGLQNIACK